VLRFFELLKILRGAWSLRRAALRLKGPRPYKTFLGLHLAEMERSGLRPYKILPKG
jgi:hypothetical protein